MQLGELLRTHRERAGFTQESLAARSGMSVRAIRDLEGGRIQRPRASSLNLLSEVLGVKLVDWHHHAESWIGRRPLPDDLVGRDDLLPRLVGLTAARGFVTVTGPGGSGKTSLALAAARRLSSTYADGVVVIDLGFLPAELPGENHVDLIICQLLSACGVRLRAPVDLWRLVTRTLSHHQLLVLDNAEHVVRSCAILVDHLRRTAPQLGLLVTSRRPLDVTGETICEVPPLDPHDAVALLRRLSVIPLSDEDGAARLCARLGGLPLAIELAAGRLRAMSPAALLERINAHPDMLQRADPNALEHQRGLTTSIEWSYRLLTLEQQHLLDRLAAFAGPFALETAEAICHFAPLADGDVARILGDLVSHSLVHTVAGHDAYHLLQPVREYVLSIADPAETRDRHLSWYANQARALSTQDSAMACLRMELADVCAAVAWGLTAGSQPTRLEQATILLAEARPLWEKHGGSLVTMTHWTELALKRAPELTAYACLRLHHWAARLSAQLGHGEESRLHIAEALHLVESMPDEQYLRLDLLAGQTILSGWNLAHDTLTNARDTAQLARTLGSIPVLANMADVLTIGGRYDDARDAIDEAIRLAGDNPVLRRKCHYSQIQLMVRVHRWDAVDAIAAEVLADEQAGEDSVQCVLNSRGVAHAMRGQYAEARQDIFAALLAAEASGKVDGTALMTVSLAFTELRSGNHSVARERLITALELCLEHGTLYAGIQGLMVAAELAIAMSHPARDLIVTHARLVQTASGLPPWPLSERDCAAWPAALSTVATSGVVESARVVHREFRL